MTRTAAPDDNALPDPPLMNPSAASSTGRAAASFARQEIKPLTTLRFFAALAVVVSHASSSFSCWQGVDRYFIVGQAVTFFFVLSGFILTYNYFDLKDLRGALKFYVARLARIWPAHLCSLFLLLALLPEVFKVKSTNLPLFFCNLFLVQAWIPSFQTFFSFNASSWSISSETFFYLCFPLLILALKERWYLPLSITGTVLVGLICLANFLHLPEFDPLRLSNQGLLYINPLSSIFDFCAGMTAALLWRDWLSGLKLKAIAATALEAGIIALVCFINLGSSAMRYACQPWAGEAGAYWIQNSGPSILGFALLVMIFAINRGFISRLFSNPLFVLLGELSFGIYMLHGVLITFLGANFPQEQSTGTCLIFLAALFVLAHLMFEVVEKPMRRLIIRVGQPLVNARASKLKQGGNSESVQPAIRKGAVPPWRRRVLITLEALAFAVFIYFSLPTVHLLSAAEANSLTTNSAVRNISLPPYLTCRSAAARKAGDKLSLTLVWEALQAQKLSFTVSATALDASGKPLGYTTYTQDGRRTKVERGACWVETPVLSLAPGASPVSVAVAVLRNKHEVLHGSRSTAPDFSLTVPVSPASDSAD